MRKISKRGTLIAIAYQALICVLSAVELGFGETAEAKIARVDAKPIPEPSSIVGTAIVGIGLLVMRSRKRKFPL